ncbi:MAG TPA: hypothetical protein VHC69_33735 [Polyangiaceae bacterium]|nr:hypothetical protein [Polyangiaceae bacterium]
MRSLVVDVSEIVQRLDDLEKRFATAERERDQYRQLYLETMERCRKLELGILSSKSEHVPKDGSQLSLDVLTMVLGDRQRAELEAALAAAEAGQEVRAHTRAKPPGRKPIPEHPAAIRDSSASARGRARGTRCVRAHRRGGQRGRRAQPRVAGCRTHRPTEVRAKRARPRRFD